jgi:hypothetical protein
MIKMYFHQYRTSYETILQAMRLFGTDSLAIDDDATRVLGPTCAPLRRFTSSITIDQSSAHTDHSAIPLSSQAGGASKTIPAVNIQPICTHILIETQQTLRNYRLPELMPNEDTLHSVDNLSESDDTPVSQ